MSLRINRRRRRRKRCQTAALIEFARQENYQVPDEWVFEDEGYSGAHLIRPGLERIRDLAAEGQIQAVLALSPDRLSRKYAYQVLLTEELARHGVDRVFIKAPHSGTPEDQLLWVRLFSAKNFRLSRCHFEFIILRYRNIIAPAILIMTNTYPIPGLGRRTLRLFGV